MEIAQKIWDTTLISNSSGSLITVGDVLLVVLALYAGYLLSRLVEFFLARRLANTKMRADVIQVIKRIAFYLILLMVGLTALSLLGIPITVFAFATGAIAIGVGFGAQNIINNFISGWILIAERPIRVDDFIEIDGALGVVQRVGTRSTQIHRTDGVHMLVPNSKLLENTVTNWTLLDRKIRTSIRVGVEYGSNPRKVSDLLKAILSEQADVLNDPAPEFIFEDFGDNALIFDAYFWCDVMGERSLRQIRSDIRFRISELFRENNIVIAFPQRDIHLHAGQAIPVALQNGLGEGNQNDDQ